MPKNATIQIKPLTPRQANFRVNENMRLGTKFTNPNFIVLEDNRASTSFSTEKKERSKNDADVAKKIDALRASIRTYQKRILKCDDEKKIAKMQSKILGYEDEIKNLENQKSGNETRGRKKEKQFVELEFCLTNTPPNGVDKKYIENFNQAIKKYIAKYFGKSSQVVTIATHLDQHSLHAHAILKLPKNLTWTDYVLKRTATQVEATDEQIKERSSKPIYDALKQAYAKLAHHFQGFMAKELNTRFDTLKKGVFYKSLSNYKKETEFNSDLKALEASKIKKETFESTNEPKTVQDAPISAYRKHTRDKERNQPSQEKSTSKSVFDMLNETLEKEDHEIYAKAKQLQDEEQPRSTELHHDDETGSSHGDVVKAKRRKRAR